MAKIILQPKKPYYISNSIDVNVIWSNNFATVLPTVATKYDIPKTLEDKVIANNTVIQFIDKYEKLLQKAVNGWQVYKNSQFNGDLTNQPPLQYPPVQPYPDLTVHTVGPYILAPHIQAATIILAHPNLTQGDKELLWLVPAKGKPLPPDAVKRVKAEDFNYPYLKIKIVNDNVVINVTRGTIFLGKSMLLQVDRNGQGEFVQISNTIDGKILDPIILPAGQESAAWTYRAIYVQGNTAISDWSPNQVIGVSRQASPFTTPTPTEPTPADPAPNTAADPTPEPPAEGTAPA